MDGYRCTWSNPCTTSLRPFQIASFIQPLGEFRLTDSEKKTISAVQRPSLIRAEENPGFSSILDSVNQKQVRPARERPVARRRMMWLLAPIVAVAAWFAVAQSSPLHEPLTPVLSKLSRPGSTVEKLPEAPILIAQAPSTPIISELPSGDESRQDSPFQSLRRPVEEVRVQPLPSVATVSKADKRPQKVPPHTAQKTDKKKTQPVASKGKSEPRVAQIKKNTRNNATSKSIASPARDSDADLLAALMAHMQTQEPAPVKTKSNRAAPTLTIAQLVARCEHQSSAERTQCVRLICAGSWGKAQACPTTLAPKS